VIKTSVILTVLKEDSNGMSIDIPLLFRNCLFTQIIELVLGPMSRTARFLLQQGMPMWSRIQVTIRFD
jgi:hypothetical protein